MGRAVYLKMKDARDIRNLDELLSTGDKKMTLADPHLQVELWMFFRSLRVRLDKAGNKTPAWKPVRGERRR